MTAERQRHVPETLEVTAAYAWRGLVVGVAVFALFLILAKLRLVVLPLVIALLLSTVLVPIARFLMTRGWPNALAAFAALGGFLGIIAGIIAILTPIVIGELDELGDAVGEGYRTVVTWLAEGPLGISEEQLEDWAERAMDQLGSNGQALTSGILSGAITLVEFLAGLILMLVITFFIVKDHEKMHAWALRVSAERHHHHMKEIGRRAWATLGGYIRGTATIAMVDAVFIGLALVIIGTPLVIPLAILTFFGGFFPVVGATVAGIVAVLVALVTQGFFEAVLVAVAVTAVQQLESNLLQPVVMARAVRLHAVVILGVLTAGAVLGGIIGAFLAVPTAAVVSKVGNYVRREIVRAGSDLTGPDPVAELIEKRK